MSQEFDSVMLDLFRQKGSYRYDNMNGVEKFKETLPSE